MERSRAKETISNLFNNRFDKDNFISFISNLLNSASFAHQTRTQNNQIHDQFRDHIESLERLTTYNDENDIEIDVLIVTLLKDTALDRARTMQRNFVAHYLNNKNKDAALVAFVFPGSADWRFSLISMETRYEGTKLVNESSPAKRWSFLVGMNEGSHTAQRQLLEILANDSEDPSLDELIEAFNIETVSKEFYEKYRELFDRMRENLKELIENDYAIEKDLREKQIKPEDFARKTMGQIAFLYFLQKKGWFGVRPGEEWGTGVRNFVRKLFERRENYGNNFFNDILEPLFYEALALDRGSAAIYPKLNNVRMPFLNGGLFEPLNGYSWETTNITLPDELFSNENKTKEGDLGDGILDIFDRYNFTVNESEPLEMEVAVDPEMLGKVFENLLPENIRKGKGAYYTPRPIVHYMCQESLINYLDTELSLNVEKEAIETFIRDESSELDLTEELKRNANRIDELLANIKVCDPAVGSGAFPLGLLNEIVKARVKIGEYTDSEYSIYDLKLHAISNSIYGVDLDPGAIEIAKLRFWLSLVVEEDTPSPLPNLDHKIMQGNSLISEYEGIKLFDDDILVDIESRFAKIDQLEKLLKSIQDEHFLLLEKGEYSNTSKADLEEKIKPINREIKLLKRQNTQEIEPASGLFDEVNINKEIAKNTAKSLNSLKAELVTTHSQSDKERIKNKIEELSWRLIEITLQEEGEIDKLEKISELKRERSKPFFLWELEFGDVFNNKGGFDLVIGNPPYIRQEKIKEWKEQFKETYQTFSGTADIYTYFYEKGFDLLNSKGHLCFITSNKWMRAKYGEKLRHFFIFNTKLKQIIDFEQTKIFESAAVDTNILLCGRTGQDSFSFQKALPDQNNLLYTMNVKELSSESFTLQPPGIIAIRNKVEKIGIPLKNWNIKINYGIKTGFNEAFIIDEVKRNELIKQDQSSEELIKPILRGKDIKAYEKNWAGLWGIATFPSLNLNINNYPAIKNHLLSFGKDRLEQLGQKLPDGRKSRKKSTNKWFETQDPIAYFGELEKAKIVYPCIMADKSRFCLDNDKCHPIAPANLITGDEIRFLLPILNSRFIYFLFRKFYMGGGIEGELKTNNLQKLPVPHVPKDLQQYFVELTYKITQNIQDNQDVSYLANKIDQLVYKLYGLTVEEIEIVENSTQ